jgi:predicted nucleic acid-binding protein
MVGLDTGFFIAYMNNESEAITCWDLLSRSDIPPIVSLLTIGELLYISFRLNKPEKGKQVVETIYIAAKVLPVDREIVEKAAALKASRGIPYIDSLILATFLISGCKEIHTTDKKHFSGLNIKGLKIIYHCT